MIHLTRRKRISRSAAYLLLLSTLNTLIVHSAASTIMPPFAHTVDGRIVCDEVIESHGLSIVVDPMTGAESLQHKEILQCSVNRAFSQSGAVDGIKLNLVNVAQAFIEERKKHASQGRTSLVVKGGKVDGSSLVLPDNNWGPSSLESESVISGAGGIYESIAPLLIWQEPASSEVASRENSGSRRLAINQTGNKSVLVFRISTDDGSGNINNPTESAFDVSAAIFGQASGDGTFNTLSSQYNACSYGQLRFSAASPAGTSATGVIDITVPSGDTTTIQNNLVDFIAPTLNLDDYDHIILHFPQGTAISDGSTDWLAYAELPGKYSSYNGESVLDVQTLMHEVGHNLNLRHSNEGTEEYGDTTCIMGFSVVGTNSINARQCFNGAKMHELGWYDSRIASIKPITYQEFDGKIIGVADYGNSNTDHILVLEIKNPNPSSESLFLTYNRAKGMNINTFEAQNQLTVVQGSANRMSNLILKIGPNASGNIPEYYEGRDLIISVGSPGTDAGSVDFLPVTVKLQNVPCTTDSDCTGNLDSCSAASCESNVCSFSKQTNCCGNGIRETNEFCSNCVIDTEAPTDCNALSAPADSWFFANSAFGSIFDITVTGTKDISIYEVSPAALQGSAASNAKVYTRLGPWESATTDLETWELVYDGLTQNSQNDAGTTVRRMTFDPLLTNTGSTRAFYVSFDSAPLVTWVSPPVQTINADITIQQMELIFEQPNGSTTRPGVIQFSGDQSFLGEVKYDYPVVTSPQPPTKAPTKTPTNSPTESPTKSPTKVPTKNPTNIPTTSPTKSPTMVPTKTPTEIPTESTTMSPTKVPTMTPTEISTTSPTKSPTKVPTKTSTEIPTTSPTKSPTKVPTKTPTDNPAASPTKLPTRIPTKTPTEIPTESTTKSPTKVPTKTPTEIPTTSPTKSPTKIPTKTSTEIPTTSPTKSPTKVPTKTPTDNPAASPTKSPTKIPTNTPADRPTEPPTKSPTKIPTKTPTDSPITSPNKSPTLAPTNVPAVVPTALPTNAPTRGTSTKKTKSPKLPTASPSQSTTNPPNPATLSPTDIPSTLPSITPTELAIKTKAPKRAKGQTSKSVVTKSSKITKMSKGNKSSEKSKASEFASKTAKLK